MSDPGRSLVLAQVTGIKDNNLVYPSCYQCYSKVYRRQDAEQTLWQCLKCKAVHTEVDIYERYRLHLSITDGSAICDVTVFGTNVDELFGCSASHFKKSINIECDGTDGLLASSLEEVFVGRFFLFGFKSSPIRRRDSEKFFRTPVTLARVIASTNRGHVHASSQVSSPALVAYQMISMQESVSKSDFPTVVQVVNRKILTRSSTASRGIPDITWEEIHHSDSTPGSASRHSPCDQTSGNLTMSYMQLSSRNSINMTYGQPSVLLSCDREDSRAINRDQSHSEVGIYLGQRGLSNQSKASHGSQQFNSNVGYQRCNNLGEQMASIGNSFIKYCSLEDNQTMDLSEINFDQSIALESQQLGLDNEKRCIKDVGLKGDCPKDIIPRPNAASANDHVDKRLKDTCHEENRDVHLDADDFNETFDPNEVDPQGSGTCGVINALSPTDQEPRTKPSTTPCDNLMQTLSDSCDSDSDSLLLLACSSEPGVGDQNLDKSPGRIVSNGSLTRLVSAGWKGTVLDVDQSQGRSNVDRVVTDSPSGDSAFPEDELPFSEDLDAFLQDMSYSQAQCSQEQLPDTRTEATAGGPHEEHLLHTRNIREASESCLTTQEKGSTQSRALCDKGVQNATGSSINQNVNETISVGNQNMSPSEQEVDHKVSHSEQEVDHKVSHSEQEVDHKVSHSEQEVDHKVSPSEQAVDPLENGSEDIFFSQDVTQQDSKVDIKSDISPAGSYGSTVNSQSMILFSGSELFSESYIDYDPETRNASCAEDTKAVNKQGHSRENTSFEIGKFDAISGVKSTNQSGSTVGTSLASVSNILQEEVRSEKKFTSRVLGQTTKIHSQHRDLYRTPPSVTLSSHVKNVQFAGCLIEAKDIAYIDLNMKTKPAPVARTRRKSCLKSGVSFVPSSVSPLQALQVSSPGIISTQMDLFSPSPEVVLRQQTTCHRLNTTFHSTPVITNNTSKRLSERVGSISICSSLDDSSDIIPPSAPRPSRLELSRHTVKSEVTKAKQCPANKENVMESCGYEGIHSLNYSGNKSTGHSKLCGGKSATTGYNQTVDSLQSQEISQDLFSSAQSGDLFSDCSWEEDLDICKKLF